MERSRVGDVAGIYIAPRGPFEVPSKRRVDRPVVKVREILRMYVFLRHRARQTAGSCKRLTVRDQQRQRSKK